MKPQILVFTFSFFVVLYIQSCILQLTIFAGCYCAIKINLWFLKHIIVDLKKTDLKAKLLWYRRVYIKTLQQILANNKYLGNVFFLFLVVNFPTNCYFLIQIKKSNDFIVKTLISCIFIEQVIVIFGVHWLIASLNSEFYKNIKFYICKFVPNSSLIARFNCTNYVSNLKISFFIQNYYATRKYGFTYGRFGLISLLAFTKVC